MAKVSVSLEKLLEVGAHFGHQVRRWNPKAQDYIFDVREGVHIFDLAKTKEALEKALSAVEAAAKKEAVILFVGTKKQAKEKIQEVAEATGNPYVNERWLGGTLSNFEQIKKSLKKLADMQEAFEKGEYKSLTKKERLLKAREMQKLERVFGGISKLEKLPDMLIVVDAKKESGAVKEAKKLDIPVVGIVDTNENPDKLDWPIPMNDDAANAITYVLDLITEVMGKGSSPNKKAKKAKKK